MATTHRPHVERLVDWFLDHDGDIYGDERERQHWYEGIAVAASIQWIAIPWICGVALWIQGAEVAWLVGLVVVALYVPMLLTSGYAERRRVRLYPDRWSAKRIVFTLLAIVPYFILGTGFLRLGSTDAGLWLTTLIGGVAGLAVTWFLMRREQRRLEADEQA